MPIHVTWANEEKTAVYWQFSGKWNWIEYGLAMQQSGTLASEVNYPIDVIVDLRASGLIPSNIFSNIRFEKNPAPDKLGQIAVLGVNSFTQRIVDMVGKLNREFKIFTVESIEQAQQLLATRRNTTNINHNLDS